MAREIYLVGVNEEELRPDPKPEGPKDFKEKWDNYWYHYKWSTIIISAVVALIAVLLFQIITKDEPDYLLVLATQSTVTDSNSKKLAAEFQKYGRDINKDGKIEVQVETLNLGDTTQYGMVNKQKLMAHYSAGDVMFYIYDKQSYKENVTALQNQAEGRRFFSKLDIQSDGIENDGRCWNWKNDPVRKDPDLAYLPENLYFGIRDVEGTASGKDSYKIHNECMELLQAYLTKTPQTNPVS